MNPFALLSLASSVMIPSLGAFVFFRNPKSTLHRLFMLLCLFMTYWAFTEFELRNSESAERASFWLTLESTWPITVALLMHFILVLTEKGRIFKHKLMYAAIYAPAVTFTIVGFIALPKNPVEVPWGWTNAKHLSFWLAAAFAWAIASTMTTLILCVRYYRRASSVQMKKMAKHVLIGLSFPVVLGTLTEIVLPQFFLKNVIDLTTVSSVVTCLFIAYAVWKHELFALSPTTAAESIVSTMSDALFLVNTENIIQTANNSALQLLGYEQHELIGHPISMLFPPESGEERAEVAAFTKMMKTGVVSDVETLLLARNGRRIPVSLSWSTTRGRDGKTLGVTFISRDITERIRFRKSLERSRHELEGRVEERTKELQVANTILRKEIAERMAAEERLAAEKEHLTVTLRSIGDGVITTDREGHVALLNKVAEELTGWTLNDATGRPLGEVFHIVDEKTRQPCEDPVARVMQAADVVSLGHNILLVARDGTERAIAESGAPIMDKAAKIRGIVLVFRDVSEKKKLEDEIFKTRKLESIALLAGGIAHDFNNVLTGIMTNLFVARTHVAPDSETHELISEAEKAAFRATILTKQLLTFSKGATPIRERIAIRGIIEESAGFCLSGSNVDYRLELDDDLYDVEVDRGQIDQVLNSIITNAEQAMPEGGAIVVSARNEKIDTQHTPLLTKGKYVVISVTDEGVGIPKSLLHRIFDPYFTTKMDCNGLGLTTAYSIVRKHEGSIEVESQENLGSTFTIYLPAYEEPHKDEAEQKPLPTGSKGKILLMDDEDYIRKSTGRLLNHLGYETTAAEDGEEAVELYRQAHEAGKPFNVVILDLTVPGGMGGKRTVDKLLEIDPEARALLSSGYTDDPAMTDYREWGFCGVISKPYEIEELSEMLQNIIGGGAG